MNSASPAFVHRVRPNKYGRHGFARIFTTQSKKRILTDPVAGSCRGPVPEVWRRFTPAHYRQASFFPSRRRLAQMPAPGGGACQVWKKVAAGITSRYKNDG